MYWRLGKVRNPRRISLGGESIGNSREHRKCNERAYKKTDLLSGPLLPYSHGDGDAEDSSFVPSYFALPKAKPDIRKLIARYSPDSAYRQLRP